MAAGVTYDPIATTTLSSAQNSVTFTSISSAYTDLILIASILADNTTGRYAYVRVGNGGIDTNSNYSDTGIFGDGSGVSTYRDTSMTFFYTNPVTSDWVSTTNPFVLSVNFQNYSNTTTFKPIVARYNNTGTRLGLEVGLWRSTSAINQISVLTSAQNFAAGSSFTLYGIAAA